MYYFSAKEDNPMKRLSYSAFGKVEVVGGGVVVTEQNRT